MPKDNGKGQLKDGIYTRGAWTIDLTPIRKTKAFRDFKRLAASGDEEALIEQFAGGLVKAWPLAGDPATVAAYDELDILEWDAVQDEVLAAIKTFRGR